MFSNLSNFIFYDPFNYLCNNCSFNEYKDIFKSDGGHLNLRGSLILNQSLENIIKRNLNQK